LVDSFYNAGVPRENVWALYENQNTDDSIMAAVKNAVS
jgi:hypothetical protein